MKLAKFLITPILKNICFLNDWFLRRLLTQSLKVNYAKKVFFFSGRLLFDSQTVSYQRGMKLKITFEKAILAEYFSYTIFFFQF